MLLLDTKRKRNKRWTIPLKIADLAAFQKMVYFYIISWFAVLWTFVVVKLLINILINMSSDINKLKHSKANNFWQHSMAFQIVTLCLPRKNDDSFPVLHRLTDRHLKLMYWAVYMDPQALNSFVSYLTLDRKDFYWAILRHRLRFFLENYKNIWFY